MRSAGFQALPRECGVRHRVSCEPASPSAVARIPARLEGLLDLCEILLGRDLQVPLVIGGQDRATDFPQGPSRVPPPRNECRCPVVSATANRVAARGLREVVRCNKSGRGVPEENSMLEIKRDPRKGNDLGGCQDRLPVGRQVSAVARR
jgi:hypothetical protein